MDLLITIPIILGSILMVANIVRYFLFIHGSHDVLSAGSRRDRIWKSIAGMLLVFFLLGYLFSAFIGEPDLVMAMILFGGSIFVAIVLTLMFNLLDTAKSRSIDIAEVLVGVIDARDPNLNGHSRHVQKLTMLFYEYLPASIRRGINPVSLEYAALMLDVGKLGVPESILNKPAKLEPEEWAIMKRHPKVGVKILEPLQTFHPKVGVKILEPLQTFNHITDWILFHHERIDGNGYYSQPGDQIPLPARIISIADTYSAITMRRSYKAPKTHEDAIQIIKDVAGTQLDAELVKYFMTIPKERLIQCIPEQVKY